MTKQLMYKSNIRTPEIHKIQLFVDSYMFQTCRSKQRTVLLCISDVHMLVFINQQIILLCLKKLS